MKLHLLSRLFWTGLVIAAWYGLRASDPTSPTEPSLLVKAGSVWRFSNDGKDLGDTWRLPDFDAAGWRSGPAQLGYGDGDEATVTREGKPPHPLTAYFRTEFRVADRSLIRQLLVRAVRDDGLVVYLNGKELVRDNMPAGEIRFDTPASSTAADENAWRGFETDAGLLRDGSNVLAAEVHQANAESSDSSFDLELIGRPGVVGLPVVSIRTTRELTSEPLPNAIVLPGQFRVVRSGSTVKELKVWLRFEGTAASGADYTALPETVTIPAGKEAVTLEVMALADELVEGPETVVAAVAVPPVDCPGQDCLPYKVNPEAGVAEVVIADEDRASTPPLVAIGVVDPDAREMPPLLPALDTARFVLERTGDPAGGLTVFFSVGGTAEPGADYKDLGRSVVFKAGERKTELEVVVVDDLAVEGDETVVVKLEPDPTMGPIEHYRVALDHAEAKAVIHDNDVGSGDVVVSIETVAAETLEFCPPNARCLPGRFLVSRTGPILLPQPVFLWVGGTAKNGVDYEEIPFLATIPAGKPSVEVVVAPKDDTLVEGNEIVVVEVSPCPPPDLGILPPCFGFTITPDRAKASVVIIDNEGQDGPPRIELTAPKDGARFAVGDVVRIEALAVDPKGFIAQLEFYANGKKIGDSVVGWPECVGCEPKPGDPAEHSFEWKGAERGIYELVAKATQRLVFQPKYEEQPIDPPAVSAPVRITVGGVPAPVRFSIAATKPVAEESSFPYRRLPLVGEFTITRAGDLTQPASVFVLYEGEAENGVDCKRLPWQVTIPAGERVAILEVNAIPDELAEGSEKLIARLSDCPPKTDPPMGIPCVAVEIDPDHAAAAVAICDNALCGKAPKLQITAPQEGAAFALGAPILIQALAVDPLGAITRVEFYADDKSIGTSEVWFIRPPDPGTPIDHEFLWKDAPAGRHTLTARAKDSAGQDVVSVPVHILVGEAAALRVAIVKPLSGAVFAPGDTVEIHAVAASANGTVARLDIIGDNELLGSTKETELTVRWENPKAGLHVLTARAVSATGEEAVSTPVRILVRDLPSVSFVERALPPAYVPGQAFEVKLVAVPPRLGSAWAVAERPPTGWSADEISDLGVFDAATGQVKFGPFLDLLPRTLTYRLTPPAAAQGRQEFSGEASLDGKVVAIGGDRLIEPSNQTHPADLDPSDFAIGLAELTAYAAAWKQGQAWPVGPVPIPLSYLTRAGKIWRHGEAYVYDASQGPPPECWVPAKGSGQPGLHDPIAHRAERVLVGQATPGAAFEVRLAIAPDAGVGAFAVQEQIPDGWSFAGADGDAAFDEARRQIRWGPYFGAEPRLLAYRVTPPANMASFAALGGWASFDGRDQVIAGATKAVAEDAGTALRFLRVQREAGALRFEVGGLPGQLCQVESSTDLIHWAPHHTVFVLEDGSVRFEDDARPAGARFFRVRPAAGR